jgi:hypothetical protein
MKLAGVTGGTKAERIDVAGRDAGGDELCMVSRH